MVWLTPDDDAALFDPRDFEFPIPTRIISNGEYTPAPQSPTQRELEVQLGRDAERYSQLAKLDRRSFLRSSFGITSAFISMNSVFGQVFNVAHAEAYDPGAAKERTDALADQFIFDGHLHFVHDAYPDPRIAGLRMAGRQMGANGLPDRRPTLDDLKFENFAKEIYLDSDTAAGIVSSATSDNPELVFLTNRQIADSVRRFNALAGSTRLYGHAVFRPGISGWLEEIEAISEHKPISWKGYTIGDPLGPSKYAWRMDDEKLVYLAYEKMQKAGIKTVCVHKGLLPQSAEQRLPNTWRHANVDDDVGKAARDWPGLNFVIYHAALKPAIMFDPSFLHRFEQTGRIDWVTDLAEIPAKFGVSNVWADVGTSFGSAAITHPRLAAGMMATLVKGLGPNRVVWGTDAVWYGSPQWQIEALRRIEVPHDLRRKFGWPELDAANGALKRAIFAENSADLYGFRGKAAQPAAKRKDRLAFYKAQYQKEGENRSNAFYGFIKKE